MTRFKENSMKKKIDQEAMLHEYDFSGGTREKYAERYAKGNSMILPEPDLAAVFPTAEAVNDALRSIVKLAQQSVDKEMLL